MVYVCQIGGVDKVVTYVVNLLDKIMIKPFGKVITWNSICNFIPIVIISMYKLI